MKKLTLVLLCICFGYHLFTQPAMVSVYVKQALLLWYEKMIPALFPFMVVSGFCIRYDICKYLAKPFYPFLNKLYHMTPEMCCTLFMGTLFGFPIGAQMCAEQYKLGYLSKKQAQFLLAFNNNIGPIYMVNFALPLIGIPFSLGLMIHICIPLCYGILLRYSVYRWEPLEKHASDMHPKTYGFGDALDISIHAACTAITKLGGYMILFILCRLITTIPFICLILEITSGIASYSKSIPQGVLLGLLNFGGISCFAQTYAVIQHTDLSFSEYVLHKSIQSILIILIYVFVSSFSIASALAK